MLSKVAFLFGLVLLYQAIGTESKFLKKYLEKDKESDKKDKCEFVHDKVWEEKCHTVFEDSCEKVEDKECRTIWDKECSTHEEKSCSYVMGQKFFKYLSLIVR